MELKQQLLELVGKAYQALKDAENVVHPATNVYADIHDLKMQLQDVLSNLEEGEYERRNGQLLVKQH